MNYLNGGYVMIKHNATQKDLAAAYKSNRPVLVYDENQKAHWAQINEKVIETVDEETQETITTYEYSYQLLNDIATLIDSAGNPRFIEGEGTTGTIEGVTFSYCKWSLSGTHLMLVVSASILNGATIANNKLLAEYEIPQYIANKITPVWLDTNIESKNIPCVANNWGVQNMNVVFLKVSGQAKLQIRASGGNTFTATADRAFRAQFDLLIDTEYSE